MALQQYCTGWNAAVISQKIDEHAKQNQSWLWRTQFSLEMCTARFLEVLIGLSANVDNEIRYLYWILKDHRYTPCRINPNNHMRHDLWTTKTLQLYCSVPWESWATQTTFTSDWSLHTHHHSCSYLSDQVLFSSQPLRNPKILQLDWTSHTSQNWCCVTFICFAQSLIVYESSELVTTFKKEWRRPIQW